MVAVRPVLGLVLLDHVGGRLLLQGLESVKEDQVGLQGEKALVALVLLHENEKDIYGDVADRCLTILREVASPHFRW